MPDLLFELFSEEIPARMQARAAEDLKSLVTNALVERGLAYEGARALVTPRRLALHVAGLPARQPDVKEERKGPRVGAPEAAVQGFLKAAGLTSLDQAKIETDPKKGEFYVAVIDKPGRATLDVLAEILPAAVKALAWPKSMRWGADSVSPSALRWVRPLHSIIATFGPETGETEIVNFAVAGIRAGNVTRGHRFLSSGEITVRRFADYVAKLRDAKVITDRDERKRIILQDAKTLAFAKGLELIEDEALLDEIAGLVEWPVALLGEFEARFLAVPEEVIRATIRANQKCFVLSQNGKLSNHFIAVANTTTSDNGATVIAGNARVIRARLSDALYFWETDQKPLPDYAAPELSGKPLDQRLAKLKALNVVFHAKLGTQGQRVERLIAGARDFAPFTGADSVLAARAAELCKADLMTEAVGEFPEVQGLMGRKYALLQGEHESVAAAIEEHYKPQGPSDRVPSDKVSVAVALADKLDTLVGFWAIDEKPTGSKDPYALRRAALGVIRLVVENQIRIPLNTRWEGGIQLYRNQQGQSFGSAFDGASLLAFFHDRLKVQLREQGARHDLIDAVFALGGQDDLLMIVRRVEALSKFLETDDGKNLLAGVKRATNIVKAEEKKEGLTISGKVDQSILVKGEEKDLHRAIEAASALAHKALAEEDFKAAMRAIAKLRAPVDSFLDNVTVNDPNRDYRENRLRLLNRIREAVAEVADFSKIEG